MAVGITADASKLSAGLQKANNSLNSWGAKTNRSLSKVEKGVSRINKSWTNLARTIASGFSVYAFTRFAQSAIAAASDLEETQSKFDTVFRGSTKLAEEWAQTLQSSFQLSERAAKEYLASIQDLLVPLGVARGAAASLSKEVVKLAVDIGSFSNKNTADVFRDIQSAMVGSFETMKKYGVALSQAAIEQKALAEGFIQTKKELTPTIRAITAFKLIVEGSSDAIGDAVKTRNSYANTLKDFKARWEDLTATIGKGFLPVASVAIQNLREWVAAYTNFMNISAFDPSGKSFNPLETSDFERAQKSLKKAQDELEGLQSVVEETRKKGPVSEETLKQLDIAKKRVEILSEGLSRMKKTIGIVDPTPELKSYADRIKDAQDAIAGALSNATSPAGLDLAKIKSSVKDYDNVVSDIEKLKAKEKEILASSTTVSPDIARHMDYIRKRQAMELELTVQNADKIKEVWINHYEYLGQLNAAYDDEKIKAESESLKKMTDTVREGFGEMEALVGGWARSAGDATADFFVDAESGFSDMIKAWAKELISFSIYQAAFKPIFGAIGNYISGGVSGGTTSLGMFADQYHRGGIVGAATNSRMVDPGVFLNAPRLHKGLMADEFPAILQKGETVIPKNQAAKESMPDIINIYNYSGQPTAQKQSQNPGGQRQVDIMIGSAFSGGKPGNKMIEQVYGLTPRGRY